MKRYFPAIVCFCLIITAVFAVFLYGINSEFAAGKEKKDLGGDIVTLNRIAQLSEKIKQEPNNSEYARELKEEISSVNISETVGKLNDESLLAKVNFLILLSLAVCLLFVFGFFAFIYKRMIKPFDRLVKFAAGVAGGDFDFPLEVDRKNTFGAFSWAFDMMRSELKEAKQNEKEALQAKKTLVATISHDIKTPVASIRAYAEAINSGMANTPERQQRYLKVIMEKADEVARLTDDLFLHAVSDMDKLSIEVGEFDAPALMGGVLEPFFAQYGEKIKKINAVPNVKISTDQRRISQVFENIIANAVKYAEDSDIHIKFDTTDGFLVCGFEDFGGGVPPEDIPFIFDKFYRGKNSKDKKGSGLGLFIVKYIVEKTGGSVSLENTEKGLLIKIGLKICDI
jgi:signal transduction histidine kinase